MSEHQTVDILIIMDCTSSMSHWIKSCQRNLEALIDEFRQKAKIQQKIRVGYLGYRDFGDKGDVDHFDIMDYSEDIRSVKEKIKKSKARGGGDIPEDLTGALKRALKFKHDADLQLIYLVTDAPCHGRQYHDCRYDDYPNQPDYDLENTMQKFAELNAKTYFTALKISDATDLMFNRMSEAFGERFEVTDRK